jgi:hypothetical protein
MLNFIVLGNLNSFTFSRKFVIVELRAKRTVVNTDRQFYLGATETVFNLEGSGIRMAGKITAVAPLS